MKKRRLLLITIGIIWGLCLTLISVTAQASSRKGTCGPKLTWELNDAGLLTIKGTGKMADYQTWPVSKIKKVIIEKGATNIGSYAFINCSNMTSISIPTSVTRIEPYAFDGCHSLRDISIPSSVTSIGMYAFSDCSSIASIVIPNQVTSIGEAAFVGCSSLTSVSIPNRIKRIDDLTFMNCSSLTSISIPDSVTSIGSGAFQGCGSLKDISIPKGVNTINDMTFNQCYELTSVSIPDSVTSIGEYGFANCRSMKDISIPESVTSIGPWAFFGCSTLTHILIPEKVTTIENYTFGQCSNLRSLSIPNGVTKIGDHAFDECPCPDLTSLTIPEGVISIGEYAFSGLQNLESVFIPNSVTRIGTYAFSYRSDFCVYLASDIKLEQVTDVYTGFLNTEYGNLFIYADPDSATAKRIGKKDIRFRVQGENYILQYIYNNESIAGLMFVGLIDRNVSSQRIPEGVTSIGAYALNGCSNLTSLSIPEGVNSIGDYAFSGCSRLASISIPEGVTSIGSYAFSGCSSLTSLLIPEGVTSIGNYAFSRCSSLTSLLIPEGVTSIGNYAFSDCSRLMSISIPEGVTSIGNYAFSRCSSLTSLSIPEGVTSIEAYAFIGCSNLMSITIPEGVTSIGNYAFSRCSSLTSISIPEGVTSIETYVFDGCSSLMSISIPEGVTSIEACAFKGCSSLMSILIPEGVTSIGENAFSGCSSLTDVSIPESVTNIGSGAFGICKSLRSISIPNNVASIGSHAFSNCNSLAYITIPESVTSIGDGAFQGCYNLTRVCFNKKDADPISFVNIFGGAKTNIYCYMHSSIDSWATSNGHNVIYLDDIDTESIRGISLPRNYRIQCGESKKLIITMFPDDRTPVTWSSSNPEIVEVSDDGTITARAVGTSTVTAICGTVSGSVDIEVLVYATDFTLSASEVWLLAGDTLQLNVESFIPSEAGDRIIWGSSDSTLAAVDQNGLITTYTPGDVTITAISELKIKRDCLVHLCYPVTEISLTAPRDRLIINRDLQVTANVVMQTQTSVNHLVTFTSSKPSIATVDPESGLVHSVGPGTVTITAASASGITASIELCVLDEYEHTPVTDEAVSATCTEAGITEGSHCATCGEIIVPQVTIPALGHAWSETTYIWSDNNSKVTATRVCGHDSEHIETETVPVEKTIYSPTAQSNGSFVYNSAEFQNSAFQTQHKQGVLPSLSEAHVLQLPDALQIIEEGAFANLNSEIVIIPKNCKEIKSHAFAESRNLIYVMIPKDTLVDERAFDNCGDIVIDIRDYNLPILTPDPVPTPAPTGPAT